MIEPSILAKQISSEQSDAATSRLRQEYRLYQKMFQSQPAEVQQHLKAQAASLAEAIIEKRAHVKFLLPDYVACRLLVDCTGESEPIPPENRAQKVGGIANWLSWTDLHFAVSQRLIKLEQSDNLAISVSAGLIRYALAVDMIHHVLPAGKSVKYSNTDAIDIPNQPLARGAMKERMVTPQDNTYTDELQATTETHGFQTPYVQAAQRYFIPQWIAFDEQGNLLTGSLMEAESYIANMQRYLAILNSALAMAPYMIVDEIYQQKKYGMLGQLVNQGRALAWYVSGEIIQTIWRRANDHRLDRGVRICLPYFNDSSLRIENYDFVIIPAGWIMFIPAFVVLAAREQQISVAQDTQLSFTTRKHLISEIHALELAFTR
jgi:hypothetical protein